MKRLTINIEMENIIRPRTNRFPRFTFSPSFFPFFKSLFIRIVLTISKKELVELINKENTTKALYINKSIRNSFGNSPKTCDSFLGKLAKGTCVTIATKTKKEDKKMFFDELHLLQNQTYEILGISDKSYVNKVVFCVGDIEYNFEKEQITVECSLIPNGIQLINQDFMSRTEYLTDENKLIITIGTEKNGEDVI